MGAARILIAILLSIFFSGIVWVITTSFSAEEDIISGSENFNSVFHIEEMTATNKFIISAYFAFTTLSSCGLGDFHPISNQERLFCAFYMMFGTAVYSFIGNKFYGMADKISNFDRDNE